MFVVIETGGKQYKISEGDKIKVEKLAAAEGGDLFFDKVLLKSDGGEVILGRPHLENISVLGKVLKHGRGKKKLVFRFKPKTRQRRKKGHRQAYTEVEIKKI